MNPIKRNIRVVAGLCSIIFAGCTIKAAPLAVYNGAASAADIGGSTPISVFSATTADAHLNAAPLIANAPAKTSGNFVIISGNPAGTETNIQKFDAAGPNIFGAESSKYFEFTPNNGVQAGNLFKSTDEASAKNVGAYFSLTLMPTAGYEMDLSLVSFRVAQLTAGNSASRGFALATSLDNFASDLAAAPRITGFRDVSGGWQSFAIDTSGMAAYQNITDPVEFRFYGWTPAGGNGIGFDKFAFDGSIEALPEPATATMFAAGVVAFCVLRYRSALKIPKDR